MNYGDALVDTFYKSFSSTGPDPSSWNRGGRADHWNHQERPASFFDEVELLKVTAPRADLERFNRNVLKIKNKWDLDISASLVVPKSEELKQRLEERRLSQKHDMLDFLFTEKIPILHDLIMAGEVETQFIRIEGSHDMVNAFNRLVERMLYDKNLTGVAINLVERRKIMVDNVWGENNGSSSLFPSLADLDSILDSIYSADFTKSAPWLHRILVA
ncbi:hypothetical protein IV203_033590 [Nitzschia inconspicua]|uniref:Uncharacterized protein n=1 Tax=Nitzschia inconspicua TaxID=303405 RepID=A0A9K3Q6W3_9STRA|nr:hypothetical protein IV203_033590 [Nitzschia inconspicua]